MKRLFIVTILTLLICFTLIGCSTTNTVTSTSTVTSTATVQQINWKFATFDSPNTKTMAPFIKWYFSELESRTNGRLKTTIFWSGELAGGPELLDAVQSGLCDVSQCVPGWFPAKMPLTNVGSLPGLGPSRSDQWNLAFNNLMDENADIQKELASWNTLYGFSLHSPTKEFGGKIAIKTCEDLNNVKIRVMSPEEGTAFKAFGAVPTVIPNADIYTSLDTGLIDVVCHSPVDFYSNNWHELMDYITTGVAPSKGLSIFLINKNSWEALPSDIQDIIIDMRSDVAKMDYYYWNSPELIKETYDAFEKQGIEIYEFPASERDKLTKASSVAWDSWVERSGGPTAQNVLDTLQANFKDVMAKYPNGIN